MRELLPDIARNADHQPRTGERRSEKSIKLFQHEDTFASRLFHAGKSWRVVAGSGGVSAELGECPSHKNERLWFTNIYAIIAAGTLTLLQLARDNVALEITVISFMVLFSVIGLLTSFRLKAELEECLHNIHEMVSSEGLDSLMALSREDGVPIRYPQFRWIFP
jgi:hypothetical protein